MDSFATSSSTTDRGATIAVAMVAETNAYFAACTAPSL